MGESEDRRRSGGYQERVGGEFERGSEGGVWNPGGDESGVGGGMG